MSKKPVVLMVLDGYGLSDLGGFFLIFSLYFLSLFQRLCILDDAMCQSKNKQQENDTFQTFFLHV